jgi:hypothetical protein
VTSLKWSDPRIAPLVRSEARAFQEELAPQATDVCADMQTWARSGYQTLSPTSREFAARHKARSEADSPSGSLAHLLKPYEGSTERALIRRTHGLSTKLSAILAGTLRGFSHLQRALGIPESPFEKSGREPVLGRGKTEAGDGFVVRRETSGEEPGPPCKHAVSIELQERSKGSQGQSEGSSSTSVCLGDRSAQQPSGGCSGEVQSITFAVPASVRTTRLLLSNGRTLTSRVIRIPRRYGGPAGVYVQAPRGYSPYPISLTEAAALPQRTDTERPHLRQPRAGYDSRGRIVRDPGDRLPTWPG